ncbi:MAG: shikimate kinase [Rhodobacteraceae bacterium]|nr:shikimate kinase [Paracoccaceae bacterium]
MRKLDKTLVLVGLMGCGKSSVGKRLAARLGVGFVDTDDEIVQAAGMPIPEIFQRLGEPAFRDGEAKVISRLLEGAPGVMATGGGAFMAPMVRAEIERVGISVWLRADLDTLWERVRGKSGRPLLETENPKNVLAELMAARYPQYAAADIVIDSHMDNSHETVVDDIMRALAGFNAVKDTEKDTDK